MGGLDLLQLMTVAKTNPAYASVVADHADHLVERIIRLFDIEPSEMLRLLHATSGVISGSAVILALIPWTFEPGDLDLYVPKSQADYALRVIQDMFDFRQSKSLGPYLQGPSIDRIIWLEKGPIKLNLIVSSSDSAIEPIFHFHSTLVMNFISSLGIFCAYPDLTFKRRGVVNMGRREYRVADLATIDCIRKYQQRDFFLSPTINLWTDTAGHACTRDPSCPHTIRSIYDSGSLFYAFRRPPWMHTTTSLFVVKMTTSPVWCFGTNLCVNAKPTIGNFVSLADVTDENKVSGLSLRLFHTLMPDLYIESWYTSVKFQSTSSHTVSNFSLDFRQFRS